MTTQQLCLTGIHPSYFRRGPNANRGRLTRQRSALLAAPVDALSKQFESLIPKQLLAQDDDGAFSRKRAFTRKNTFWGFFFQTLQADGSCQEVVRRFQAAQRDGNQRVLSSSTAAYCKARSKLDVSFLQEVLEQTNQQLAMSPANLGKNKRRIVVVDGTGLSMADTPSNQERWPQSARQKPGCGFPSARLLGLFNLTTGGHISYALGNKRSHELPALRRQWDHMRNGDILLGGRAFCSYFDIAQIKMRGVDSIVNLKRKPIEAKDAVKVLGANDLLIRWPRPRWGKCNSYTQEQLAETPDHLLLRQIKVEVNQPGFRTTGFHIVTTLTDAQAYPAEQIAALYFQRWQVELNFRDLKTTLGMDVLRCKTPEMIEKEILMHMIVYNCIRWLIMQAASQHGVNASRVSFKGAIQALRQWEATTNGSSSQALGKATLIDAIASLIVCYRPGRYEPRCIKRRPKQYQRLTGPRHIMRDVPHRGKRAKKEA